MPGGLLWFWEQVLTVLLLYQVMWEASCIRSSSGCWSSCSYLDAAVPLIAPRDTLRGCFHDLVSPAVLVLQQLSVPMSNSRASLSPVSLLCDFWLSSAEVKQDKTWEARHLAGAKFQLCLETGTLHRQINHPHTMPPLICSASDLLVVCQHICMCAWQLLINRKSDGLKCRIPFYKTSQAGCHLPDFQS